MPYLKKIVGFFVVSVFSMFNCLAMDGAVPNPEGLNNTPRLVCHPPVDMPRSDSSSDLREQLFSPGFKPLALPVTMPSNDSSTAQRPLSVTVRGPVMPVMPKLEINSPVTILLSPTGLMSDDELLSPTEALSPTFMTTAGGAAVLSPADDSSSVDSTTESATSSVASSREGSVSRVRMPTLPPNMSKSFRRTRRLSASTAECLNYQAAAERYMASMPSSPILGVKRVASEDMGDDSSQDTKLILSIDGGGSRGIIPLAYLAELQSVVGKLKFDMVAGTSVGAMIGAAVVLDKVDDMHDNFQGYVDRIFVKNWWSFGGLLRPTYSSDGRAQVIDEIVQDMNGRELNDKYNTLFIAPYYSLLTREANVYRNYDVGDKNSEEFKLRDILMMTSAAPTYFNPHNCTSVKGTAYEGIDGGVFANHPGSIAYQEARRLFPNSKIFMLSLGTGTHNSCDGTNQSRNRGLLYWAQTVTDVAIDGTSFLTNSILIEQARSDPNFKYIRLQTPLEKSYMITDGTDPEHIKKLESAVRRAIGNGGSEQDRFQTAVDMLSRHYDGSDGNDDEQMSD